MATIKDVAKLAGVSITTVSHVVNNTRFVAEETTKAVHEAIKQLNYFPSAAARSLKVNHTNTIGLLAVTNDSPYYAEVIKAVEEACYQQGYMLIPCNAHKNSQKQKAYLAMLAQKRIDGLLVMCSEYPKELLNMLNNYQQIPMMIMDWDRPNNFTDNIDDNGFQGAYLATQYLIERGHKEIGTITGLLNEYTGSERHKGFLQALQDANIPLRMEWVIEADFQAKFGYQGMKQILAQNNLPTALFCGGDIIAMGAICAIAEHGLNVPDNISVIGYDNLSNSCFFNPALTTIHQPTNELGKQAVYLLIDRIINKREINQTIKLQPTLVERCSVANGPYF